MPALCGPPITTHLKVTCVFQAVPHPHTKEHLNKGEGVCFMKSLRPWVKTRHCDASCVLSDLRRHFPGPQACSANSVFRRGRAGRTPADAREGPVPGRGVARRGSSGPAHWPSIRPSPSPAASLRNPERIPPRPFTPGTQSCSCPNNYGLAAEARGLGRRPRAYEEAAAGARGLGSAGPSLG